MEFPRCSSNNARQRKRRSPISTGAAVSDRRWRWMSWKGRRVVPA
nr:hypothetical protein [Methylacidiphilum caldifontis]